MIMCCLWSYILDEADCCFAWYSWTGGLCRGSLPSQWLLEGLRVSLFVNSYERPSEMHNHSIVEYSQPEEARKAIEQLSDTPLMGRPVFIREVSAISDI